MIFWQRGFRIGEVTCEGAICSPLVIYHFRFGFDAPAVHLKCRKNVTRDETTQEEWPKKVNRSA